MVRRGGPAAGLILDERVTTVYLGRLATQLNRPTIEAGVVINGRQVEVQPGQIGRQLDISAGIGAIAHSVGSLTDAVIDLPWSKRPRPSWTPARRQPWRASCWRAPFSLTADGADPWVFEPEELAGLIRFRRVEDGGAAELVVGLDDAVIDSLPGAFCPPGRSRAGERPLHLQRRHVSARVAPAGRHRPGTGRAGDGRRHPTGRRPGGARRGAGVPERRCPPSATTPRPRNWASLRTSCWPRTASRVLRLTSAAPAPNASRTSDGRRPFPRGAGRAGRDLLDGR